MVQNGLNWMVGGPQGSGVDSAAKLFALSAARSGLHVVGQREYYSNIMGKHSYYKIRASRKPLRSPAAGIHMLATYDEETLVRHINAGDVVEGGAVLYAEGHEDTQIDKLPNMDKRVKEDAKAKLDGLGLPHTAGGMVEMAKKQGIQALPMPYEKIIERVGEEMGLSGSLGILKNTCAVGASLGLFKLPSEHLDETVKFIFAGKSEKVHQMNILAAKYAAEYALEKLTDYVHELPAGEASGDRVWLQGTQAVALGKILAGCRFHTYYPISPATDEATYLEAHPESDVVVVQTEDEIAAATMAIGAALTGARSGTSTSGPGFNLMVEALGWAGMCETPIVVVDYMRGGPSTGLPTRTEQGDLQFTLRMGHSDYPRIVIAPGDLEEMFYDTIRAYEWAERYQTPVILLPDKALAGNSATIDIPDTSEVDLDRGKIADADYLAKHAEGGKFRRFAMSDDGISTRSVLGQKDGIHWLTGDEHTDEGHITEDTVTRDVMMAKRLQKLETAGAEIPPHLQATLHGPKKAKLTIVAWGSTKGAILEAMDELNEDGDVVNFLQFRIFSPFPDEAKAILESSKSLLCVEENATGQLRDLITERTGIRIPHVALKTNGRPTMPHEVADAVQGVLAEGREKVVMTHGV